MTVADTLREMALCNRALQKTGQSVILDEQETAACEAGARAWEIVQRLTEINRLRVVWGQLNTPERKLLAECLEQALILLGAPQEQTD